MAKGEETQRLCFLRIPCVALSLISMLQNGEHIQGTEILDLNRLCMLHLKLFFFFPIIGCRYWGENMLRSKLVHPFFIPCHFIFPRAK